MFLVFGGCKLSSDAPNTRDMTPCRVSGVRYMGEWHWLRGGKIGTEQERCAHSACFSCSAGGGVCARDRVETVSNTYEKHKKKGEAYCVPLWVA